MNAYHHRTVDAKASNPEAWHYMTD